MKLQYQFPIRLTSILVICKNQYISLIGHINFNAFHCNFYTTVCSEKVQISNKTFNSNETLYNHLWKIMRDSISKSKKLEM